MLDRRPAHSRMAAATERRIVPLALARTIQYAPRTSAAPGLVATVPDEPADHRPNI
jgi:hypothetical protein